MRKYFGTDGIRGQANSEPLTPQTLTRLGQAIGLHFMRGDHCHRVVIGKDTRLSGYMVESALASGFVSVGMDVAFVGPLPTPAVSMLTRSMRADLGVMISASHNLYEDNGIKLFDPDGFKLSDEVEKEIESRLDSSLFLVNPPFIGQMVHVEDAVGRYVEYVKSSLPRHMNFEGLRIVVDCAHGAAYKVAPVVLKELGATVIPLSIAPNGKNINANCGATSPQEMCETVVRENAHMGVAFDGDADRAVFSDEKGNLIDGDQIMALIATDWQNRGLLKGKGIVSTLMSNLGLEQYLKTQKLSLIRTSVGDRYVSEKMRDLGCNVGGEPSGHVIISDFATSGDGLLTALQVVSLVAKSNEEASQIMRVFKPVPQLQENIKLPSSLLQLSEIQDLCKKAQDRLGENGRLVIRPSGTEPLIRIMAEHTNKKLIKEVVDFLTSQLTSHAQKDVA